MTVVVVTHQSFGPCDEPGPVGVSAVFTGDDAVHRAEEFVNEHERDRSVTFEVHTDVPVI